MWTIRRLREHFEKAPVTAEELPEALRLIEFFEGNLMHSDAAVMVKVANYYQENGDFNEASLMRVRHRRSRISLGLRYCPSVSSNPCTSPKGTRRTILSRAQKISHWSSILLSRGSRRQSKRTSCAFWKSSSRSYLSWASRAVREDLRRDCGAELIPIL